MSTPIEQKPTPPAGTPERGEPLRQIVAAATEPASSHLGARLRSYFLTGLIVVGPVAITIYVVWWFITLVDAWVKPLIPPQYLPEHYLPFNVPGVGLIFGITGVMLVGALTANLFGRTLVTYSEMMLARMPIVRERLPHAEADLRDGALQEWRLVQARRADRVSAARALRHRVPRRRAAARGGGEDRRRQSDDHRVHAERRRTRPLGSSSSCRQAK